jgi:quercetin dioxygenase-like cupin family protein
VSPPRRVITGLDAQGRSGILVDGPSNMVIWSADDSPANNSGTADAGGGDFRLPTSGTLFVFSDFPPGRVSPMHATDTIDYIVVVLGEVVFITETGETLLRAGDVLVDRGIMQAWRNDSDKPCRIMIVLCPAHPVGSGATVSEEVRSTSGNA